MARAFPDESGEWGFQFTDPPDAGEIDDIVAQPLSKRWPAGLLALGGVVLLAAGIALMVDRLQSGEFDLSSGADARGQVGARVDFDFPLIRDLGFEHVRVSVVANLTGVFLREVLMGRDAAAGEFALVVDNDGMTLVGPVRIADIPAALSWRESFKKGAEPKSLFGLTLEGIDEDDLAGFGLDLKSYLDGPVGASIDVKVAQDGQAAQPARRPELRRHPARLDHGEVEAGDHRRGHEGQYGRHVHQRGQTAQEEDDHREPGQHQRRQDPPVEAPRGQET